MKEIEKVRQFLGEPYIIMNIDLEEVIYRDLGNGYDFEVSGVRAGHHTYSLYVWKLEPNREIVAIYHQIHGCQELKDLLGYCAFIYQNLDKKIQIERQELPE